jgi:single-strand DNA-binding protein
MRNYSKVTGNLGADPELRVLDNGKKVVDLNIGVNNTIRDSEGNFTRDENTPTHWYKVSAWEGVAEEISAKLHKGDLAEFRGEIDAEAWIDKETGEPRKQLKITARKFEKIASPNKNRDAGEDAPVAAEPQQAPPVQQTPTR